MGTQKLHYDCGGNVVVYKRKNSRTISWFARVKLEHNGRWKKFSTKTQDLDEALSSTPFFRHRFYNPARALRVAYPRRSSPP
jgi:hypothetical protein